MTMTRERFQALADAYGGDVSRWPADVRDAALARLTADPEHARGVLARAGDMDALLDGWAPQPVGADLRDRILASAPRPRRTGGFAAWLGRAGLGAGLAAACVAGVVVGARLTESVRGPAAADDVAAALVGYEGVAESETEAVG